MATYTSLAAKSTVKALAANKFDRSISGIIRGQNRDASSLYFITIVHTAITVAEVGTLQTFFTTNHNTVITTQTLKDGFTYDCLLVNEPEVTDISPTHKTVTQRLTGTRN